MAKRADKPNDVPKKIPLKCLALDGSLETYSWYHENANRLEVRAMNILATSSASCSKIVLTNIENRRFKFLTKKAIRRGLFS